MSNNKPTFEECHAQFDQCKGLHRQKRAQFNVHFRKVGHKLKVLQARRDKQLFFINHQDKLLTDAIIANLAAEVSVALRALYTARGPLMGGYSFTNTDMRH